MNSNAIGMELALVMEKETEILDKICNEEKKLQKAIIACNWDAMERTINALEPLSNTIKPIDERRNNIYAQLLESLNKSEDSSFYSIAMKLSGKSKDLCLEGYRKLKIALLKMKGTSLEIDQYTRIVGETKKNILDEILPYMKGDIYSSKGMTKPASSDPMVVSRSL